MTIKLRLGMDINLHYSIMRGDAPENLNNADNISVKLAHTQSTSWQLPNSFEIVGDNTLNIRVKGGDQTKLGVYYATPHN